MTGAPSLLWGKEPEAKGMKPSSTRDPPSVRQGDLAQGTTPRSIADPHQGFRAGMCAQGTEPKSGLGPAQARERGRERETEREEERESIVNLSSLHPRQKPSGKHLKSRATLPEFSTRPSLSTRER